MLSQKRRYLSAIDTIGYSPNMNMTKKINVNFSSLVALKAELLRKQAEVNEAKLKTEPIHTPPQLSKKKNKKTAVENKKTSKETTDLEDIVAHKKSRLMLEAKTRLYERLKRSKNNNDKFLVDFKNKLDESDEESVDKAICEEYPIEPEENWVEYQDCFGRTRKCLREDLPHMQRKDDLIKQEVMKRSAEENREENKEQYVMQEKEPEIEIMRRKWEEQTRKLADKIDIHYQDILFDEARTHGVGYYAFSQDEEERAKQQENLSNLRKETEKKQKELKEIKELKERMEQNRLKAARIRQRIRAGLPAEPTEEELAEESKSINSTNTDTDINAEKANESAEKNEEKSSEETDNKSAIAKENDTTNEKAENDEDKIRAFGELLGKKNHWHVMSQEEWVHKCRAQRINEFAPMYDNFVSAGLYNSSKSIDGQVIRVDKKPDNIETSNSQKTVEDFNDLEKYEILSNNESTSNESIAIKKDIDNNSQNINISLAAYNTENDKDSTRHELSRNETKTPTSSPATSLTNLSPSQKQTTVSYPLSHLSGKYSQNMYGYQNAYVPEQSKLPKDLNIPLPDDDDDDDNDDDTSAAFNSKSTHANEQEALSRSINEDSIMAGLKYLREKFEENHSK